MDPSEVVNKIDRCPSTKFLELNFGCSDYTRYAPGVRPEEMIIKIPESGELPKVAQELDIDQLLVDYHNWVFRDGKTSSNIGVLVLQNLQNFERVDAQKTTVLGLPAVKMSNDEGMNGEEIILPWIEVRNEWVFVYHLFFPEAGGLSDDLYKGPFALDEMCSSKILEAYGLNKNSVDLKSVPKTSPYELEKIAKEKATEKMERDICVVLGVLIEQEQWHRNTGKVYYGSVDLKGGGLSFFDNEHKTALHKKRSEDYLYLRADYPKLKGIYIPVEKSLIKKLINDAIQNGEASTSFEVSDMVVDTRQTAPEDRIIEHQAYEQDYEKYSGRVDLHLKVGANFAQDLLSREAAYWSQGPSPKLEFIVKAEGSTVWK